MLARLTLYEPEQPARQFLLEQDEQYLIGRDESCDIPVANETLSRRHAKLAFADGVWRLSDLCSKNGTLINGRPVNRHLLSTKAWIEFGTVLACFDFVSREALERDERQHGERWQTSMQLSREFRPTMSRDELLGRVIDTVLSVSGAERGFLMLEPESEAPKAEVCRPADGADYPGSRSVVRRAAAENRAVVCSDTTADADLGAQPSIATGAIRALACVPLRVGDTVTGVIYVDSRETGKQFTNLDIEILQALADHAALVIGVAALRENIVDLSDMLPAGLDRSAPADEALIAKVQRLLPRLQRAAAADVAVAGADS